MQPRLWPSQQRWEKKTREQHADTWQPCLAYQALSKHLDGTALNPLVEWLAMEVEKIGRH